MSTFTKFDNDGCASCHQGLLSKRQRTATYSEKAAMDMMLAKGMSELTLEEREIAQEEVHGIANVNDENPSDVEAWLYQNSTCS